MLRVEGVVCGVRDASFVYVDKEGKPKKVEKYLLHIGDPAGGDPIEVGSPHNGRKFGDKVAFAVAITHAKNGKTYLNEIVQR